MKRFLPLTLTAVLGVALFPAVHAQGYTFKTLASFDITGGYSPRAGLTLSGGILYGKVTLGGAGNVGAVFSVPVGGGSVTTLASFNGANGAKPACDLTLSDGTLYGTT